MQDVLLIHTDGGSRNNPGPGAIAVVIRDKGGNLIKEYSERIGKTTNNRAEYLAIIRALEMAAKLCRGEVRIFSDSENTVKQLKGTNRVRDVELQRLHGIVKDREKLFEKVTYNHVRREDNKRADWLVNRALDGLDLHGGM